ncbi:hypothetical protein V2J09_020871 [Rumex salicifolius]
MSFRKLAWCWPSRDKNRKSGEKFVGAASLSDLTTDQISQLLSLVSTTAKDTAQGSDDFAGFAGAFYEAESEDW